MNRLHSALSPYLLLHAHNPVHWQPWDAASLAQAQREDKPILLSIGYAACHWCHVMEEESFANEETAALMNAHFINIKVDREERPDLDKIYQAAHSAFTRASGGWPLTMFLTPAGAPFFGGTYFPPEARHGLPPFPLILQRVAEAWAKQRAEIEEQNAVVLAQLRRLDAHTAEESALDAAPLRTAATQLGGLFDAEHGGLGGAPKFPHPVELDFCMRQAAAHPSLLPPLRRTLTQMAAGGLYDHLGGGFFRYCVDARWQVPHFEKMLYDNGLLLALYADAAAAWGEEEPALVQAVHGTAEWALAEMRDDSGAFYASRDADSAGGEGAFYLWDEAELQSALSSQEAAVVLAHFGVPAAARVEGKVHLARRQTVAQTARACELSEDECAAVLTTAREKLLRVRGAREVPAIDDKTLTGWNGLMIFGLARAARCAPGGKAAWAQAARAAFDAVWANLRVDGRTRTARRGAQVSAHGFLDDVAFLLAAAVELLRWEFCPKVFAAACALAEELCTQYEDEEGGFFFTAADGETLIRRIKSGEDGATPSGNGMAAQSLLILAALAGREDWRAAAEGAVRAFYPALREHAAAHASLLTALHMHLLPKLVLLTGDAATCRKWQAELDAVAEVFCLPPDTTDLPPVLQKPAVDAGKGACAYVCDAHGCRAPVTTLAQVRALLES